MGNVLCPDLITNLPKDIIDNILIKLPIRDALKTSILSSKWKYKWCSIPQLVFDENCVPLYYDQKHVVEFICKVLSLHKGPLHKFEISHRYLQSCPEIDQWILSLSKKNIADLTLELGKDEFFRMPSCLFNCEKLTRLKLSCCELDLPHSFNKFPCLKSLNFERVLISSEAIERLISSCPLLENFSLTRVSRCLTLTIFAPKLKYLCLKGVFKDICLVDMPFLDEISVSMYMPNGPVGHVEPSTNCNFAKFLGSVPNLKRLDGFTDFSKYLSIGHHDLKHTAIMYNNLEIIRMDPVCFDDMKEIRVILCLITSSPNLKKLYISCSSNIARSINTEDLNILEKEFISHSLPSKLKIVILEDMSGVPLEIDFIRLLLGWSPVLEKMIVIP